MTQLGSDDPLVIQGVGTISQGEGGKLLLKLFQQKPLPFDKVFAYQQEKSGGKISSARGFRLEATEYGGGTWTSEYLQTQESLNLGEGGCWGVFSGYVESLTSSSGTPFALQKSTFEGIIPFEIELPFNRSEKGKKNSYPERMLRFIYNRTTKVEILRSHGYTSIKISNKFELVSERFIEALLQGISIATGKSLQFVWQQYFCDSFHRQVIREYDFDSSENTIGSPISLRYCAHLTDFLEKYIHYSLRNDHNYFGYWKKLHASWASGLAVAALPLSVYVEGVVKEFYPELMVAESPPPAEINSTIAAINNIVTLEKRIKDRLCNSIRSSTKGSVAIGLRTLVHHGCIDKQLAVDWQYVRNRSAHGNDFTQEQVESKIQEIVSGIFSCLHLFYELLHLKLHYSGYVINYSKIGFPEEFRYADRVKLPKFRLSAADS
ncbi:hypothetical protein FEE59_24465 [Herbaspirillum sp. RU 5E]|nr:hypothetical protein [Herbaspirillum sp. RU 5E]